MFDSHGSREAKTTNQTHALRRNAYCGHSSGAHGTSYDVYRVYSPADTTGSVGIKAYNTGKVLIGSAYQPRQHYDLSLDSERLQEALLESKQARDARTEALFMRWLYGIALITLVIVIATR